MSVFHSYFVLCIPNNINRREVDEKVNSFYFNDNRINYFGKFLFGNDNERFKEADLDKNGKLSHDEYHELFGHGS